MTAAKIVPAVLLPLALATSGCEIGVSAGGADGSFDRDLTVSGPLDLDVQSGSGSIEVRTGPGGAVHVHGRIRAGMGRWISVGSESTADRVRRLESNPPIEQAGNTIRIGQRDRSWNWNGISVSYDVTVPAGTRVKAASGSGDLTIGDVAGPVHASTGSGSIRVGRVAEEVETRTGSGDIEVNGSKSLNAETGSGSIRANAVRGSVAVRSGSGDISVAQEAAGNASLGTGSGSITLTGARGSVRVGTGSGDVIVEGTTIGEWDVSASSGSVRLRLPARAAFDLEAHTGSGSIDTSLPVSMAGRQSKRELRGTVGGGGPLVRVSTSSGDIEIR
jgi:DUF4097 and DUF4098 domain-containing protein YvlB